MPTTTFSWDQYDGSLIIKLAVTLGCPKMVSHAKAKAWLLREHPMPSDSFVSEETRTILERDWLGQFPDTLQYVVNECKNRRYGDDEGHDLQDRHVEYLATCKFTTRYRRLLLNAFLKFGDPVHNKNKDFGACEEDKRAAYTIRPDRQGRDERPPYPYQEEAWRSLTEHLKESESPSFPGGFQGLLVMPTGSGKTYTAIRWLMENVVARGGRILWLAHQN